MKIQLVIHLLLLFNYNILAKIATKPFKIEIDTQSLEIKEGKVGVLATCSWHKTGIYSNSSTIKKTEGKGFVSKIGPNRYLFEIKRKIKTDGTLSILEKFHGCSIAFKLDYYNKLLDSNFKQHFFAIKGFYSDKEDDYQQQFNGKKLFPYIKPEFFNNQEINDNNELILLKLLSKEQINSFLNIYNQDPSNFFAFTKNKYNARIGNPIIINEEIQKRVEEGNSKLTCIKVLTSPLFIQYKHEFFRDNQNNKLHYLTTISHREEGWKVNPETGKLDPFMKTKIQEKISVLKDSFSEFEIPNCENGNINCGNFFSILQNLKPSNVATEELLSKYFLGISILEYPNLVKFVQNFDTNFDRPENKLSNYWKKFKNLTCSEYLR